MFEDEYGLFDLLENLKEKSKLLDKDDPEDLKIIKKYIELKEYLKNIAQMPFMNSYMYHSMLYKAREINEYVNNKTRIVNTMTNS